MPKDPRRGHINPTKQVTHSRPRFPQGGARIAQNPSNPDEVMMIDGETGNKEPWNTPKRVTGTVKGWTQ